MNIKKGDKVSWNTPQGETSGTVVKKLTQDTQLGKKTYRASRNEPKIKVRSKLSQKEAIHKPSSLKKK